MHKLLEKEIRPETIHVDIDTNEERWALRCGNIFPNNGVLTEVVHVLSLVNMLSCLECLMTLGCAVIRITWINFPLLITPDLSEKCLYLESYMTRS